jgi:hypothetical protein
LQTSTITTYALASRLRASWMEARVTKVARVSARFSKSLARRWVHVVAPLDDLHAQQRHLCHRSVNLPRVVAAIGPDQFEPREAPSYLVEHQPGAVAILDRGRVDNHPHQQSLRRRLRLHLWRQWQNGPNRFKELRRHGVPKFNAAVAAGSPTGFWRMSGHPAVQQALRNPLFR